MPRTAAGLRTDPAARLAELERRRPEWAAWFNLLGEVERALEDAGWRTALDETALAGKSADSPAKVPLLNGQTLRVDGVRVQRLIGRLATTASALEGGTSLQRYRPPADEAVALIGAAVRQERDRITTVAGARGIDARALASVTHLAALPLLRSCARMLHDRIPRHWPHGYCPICAAWPILVERRGLDRSHRLRCGRCAGEWEVEWLTCIFCGERNHQRLGSLGSDDSGEMLKVDICATCRGYLKSVATLQAIPAFELLPRDLETVEFDLIALERGYCRPSESGFALNVQIIDYASRRDL
jgi:FdhE protein